MKYSSLLLLFFWFNANCQVEPEISDTVLQTETIIDSIQIETVIPPDSTIQKVVEDKRLTGSLTCNIKFNQFSGCGTSNLVMTSKKDTLRFLRVQGTDTLTGIPAGTYRALFYDCDSTHQYSQKIEIIENQTRQFNFLNNANMNTYNYNYNSYNYDYYNDSNYVNNTSAWLNHGLQFGRGLDYEKKSIKVESNYSFQYSVGMDYLILGTPLILGFDIGLRYEQSNFEKTDFVDTTVSYEKYRFSNYSLSASFLTSVYAKGKKFIDIGVMYNMPLYSRIIAVNGNQKISTKDIHNYKDFRFVAHVGYYWGFLFGEFRPDIIIKSPYEDAPKLTLGIRFNVPIDWY